MKYVWGVVERKEVIKRKEVLERTEGLNPVERREFEKVKNGRK